MHPPSQLEQYQQDGYTIARGLFSTEEVDELRTHFMTINVEQVAPACAASGDPLRRYPRIMQPHRWDDLSRRWLTDARLDKWLTTLLGASPYAVQTMLYFKPAGARGQALHQDQYYLRVQPGTCMAAWMALDACDEENGCLQVVPKTHNLPTMCTVDADTQESFTADTIELSEGMAPVPVRMEPGDVLFFNGQIIHGSYPNTSKDRFRRALIGHYIVAEAEKVAEWYHPILRMDGTTVELGTSELGGPCGLWVDEDGEPVAKVAGIEYRQQG